jgi:hypothetical protein
MELVTAPSRAVSTLLVHLYLLVHTCTSFYDKKNWPLRLRSFESPHISVDIHIYLELGVAENQTFLLEVDI